MIKNPQRVLSLFLVLAISWLLWSGIYKPLLLGLGVLSCLISLVVARRIGLFDQPVFPFQLLRRLPAYWAWLLVEIVKSSIEVARIVLNPRLPIDPTLVKLKAAPKGTNGLAILGNAITLTPGTLTLDISDGQITVHCLSKEGAKALRDGEMNKKTAALTDT